MGAKVKGMMQARRNANDAVSMLQVAEGGMNEMTNIMVRMRELTVQSATDTVGVEERRYLNREFTELASEIDRIAATAEFNGNKFFIETPGVDRSSFTVQVGPNGTPVERNEDTISIDLQGLRFSAGDLGLGKGAEIGPSAQDASPSRDMIAGKLATIDKGLDRVAKERATLGALQSRIDSTINNLGISIEKLTESRSRIIETDYAEETAHLTHESILTQAGLSVLSQANQHPNMALKLLGS
jgi:flagellin